MNKNSKVIFTWQLLRVSIILLWLSAGIDKFLYLTTNWGKYISDPVLELLPVSINTFIKFVGILEILLAILIFFPKTIRLGCLLGAIWLVIISVNLFPIGIYYDIAIRDIIMAISQIALYMLTPVVQEREIY